MTNGMIIKSHTYIIIIINHTLTFFKNNGTLVLFQLIKFLLFPMSPHLFTMIIPVPYVNSETRTQHWSTNTDPPQEKAVENGI